MRDGIFLTGATGYMGRRLAPALLQRSHRLTALVRPGSESKVAPGVDVVLGNALQGESYRTQLEGCHTFVHLCGVSHPSPAKARQFVEVDLRSTQEAVRVAVASGIRHFVYVSVAQPAPAMKSYVNVRRICEDLVVRSGMRVTILRPWYVLGPGHWWPLVLQPAYAIAMRVPWWQEGARRLGLVSIGEMIAALVSAVENPAIGVRRIEVPEIRSLGQENRRHMAKLASC